MFSPVTIKQKRSFGATCTITANQGAISALRTTNRIDDGLKRTFDVVLSLVLIALVSPLFVLITLAIRIASPGPVLFLHERIGQHGRRFHCLKFRTMVPDSETALRDHLCRHPEAEAEWKASQKLRFDPRISIVGGLLRRWSLDELPQLLNVLVGEMSLVGPRPVTESELSRYGHNRADYCKVRPGITGVWQISGRNSLSFEKRISLDTNYARNRSFAWDLLVLAKTLPAVISTKGAY